MKESKGNIYNSLKYIGAIFGSIIILAKCLFVFFIENSNNLIISMVGNELVFLLLLSIMTYVIVQIRHNTYTSNVWTLSGGWYVLFQLIKWITITVVLLGVSRVYDINSTAEVLLDGVFSVFNTWLLFTLFNSIEGLHLTTYGVSQATIDEKGEIIKMRNKTDKEAYFSTAIYLYNLFNHARTDGLVNNYYKKFISAFYYEVNKQAPELGITPSVISNLTESSTYVLDISFIHNIVGFGFEEAVKEALPVLRSALKNESY